MPSTPIVLTEALLPTLKPREPSDHKGLFGHLMVIGGDYGTAGAPLLSAEMAVRAGTGLVSLATRESNITAIIARCPTLMPIAVNSANQLITALTKASVITIGMGLGQQPWGRSLFSTITSLAKPQVWDADALNLLAKKPILPSKKTILTPHPGEAARLLQTTTDSIQQNRPQAIQELVKQYQCTIILKGAGTLISAPNHPIYQCNLGHPAMAGAGFGDILSGLTGALLAQHLSPIEAAVLAVWLHAKAGQHLGLLGRGLLATDLIPTIRQLLEEQSPCLH